MSHAISEAMSTSHAPRKLGLDELDRCKISILQVTGAEDGGEDLASYLAMCVSNMRQIQHIEDELCTEFGMDKADVAAICQKIYDFLVAMGWAGTAGAGEAGVHSERADIPGHENNIKTKMVHGEEQSSASVLPSTTEAAVSTSAHASTKTNRKEKGAGGVSAARLFKTAFGQVEATAPSREKNVHSNSTDEHLTSNTTAELPIEDGGDEIEKDEAGVIGMASGPHKSATGAISSAPRHQYNSNSSNARNTFKERPAGGYKSYSPMKDDRPPILTKRKRSDISGGSAPVVAGSADTYEADTLADFSFPKSARLGPSATTINSSRGRGASRGVGRGRGAASGGIRGGFACRSHSIGTPAPLSQTTYINKSLIPCKWGGACFRLLCEYGHPNRKEELPKSSKFSGSAVESGPVVSPQHHHE